MRLQTALKKAEKEYLRLKNDPKIRKPVARALYNAWRWADSYEKERKAK